MKVVLVEPGRGREIADTSQIVAYGDEVEVSEELGGRPPKGDPSDEDYDPGAGLLAQVDVWAKPGTKAAKEAAAAAAAERAEAEKAAGNSGATNTEGEA